VWRGGIRHEPERGSSTGTASPRTCGRGSARHRRPLACTWDGRSSRAVTGEVVWDECGTVFDGEFCPTCRQRRRWRAGLEAVIEGHGGDRVWVTVERADHHDGGGWWPTDRRPYDEDPGEDEPRGAGRGDRPAPREGRRGAGRGHGAAAGGRGVDHRGVLAGLAVVGLVAGWAAVERRVFPRRPTAQASVALGPVAGDDPGHLAVALALAVVATVYLAECERDQRQETGR
jgi:hypothetical protein